MDKATGTEDTEDLHEGTPCPLTDKCRGEWCNKCCVRYLDRCASCGGRQYTANDCWNAFHDKANERVRWGLDT